MVSAELIGAVLQKAIQVATHSWEYGTVAEALLEWNSPKLSIWNDPFPNGKIPTLNAENVSALSYVKPFIRTDNITLVDGDGQFRRSLARGNFFKLTRVEQVLPATQQPWEYLLSLLGKLTRSTGMLQRVKSSI